MDDLGHIDTSHNIQETCVSIDADEEGVGGIAAAELQLAVKQQRIEDGVAALLSDQKPKEGGKHVVHKRHRRAMLRKLGRKALQVWRESQTELLKDFSRLQLLSALTPEAAAAANKKRRLLRVRKRKGLRCSLRLL